MGRLTLLTTLIASTAALQRSPLRNVAQRKAQNAAPVREQQATGLAENLENVLEPVGEIVVTAMRVGTCALMIHHGLDKIVNVDGFSANVVQKFFGFLPGPAPFWTLSAAATQVVGAGFLAIGLFSRPAAAAMTARSVWKSNFRRSTPSTRRCEHRRRC